MIGTVSNIDFVRHVDFTHTSLLKSFVNAYLNKVNLGLYCSETATPNSVD